MSDSLTSMVTRGGLIAALALALGWSPASAQTGQLVGSVRDAASQRPLEAVQVYIEGTGIGALTNAAGRFLLLNVPAGEVTLRAEIVGYRSGTQTVTVAVGQSTVVDFALQQTAISLDEIVVTGAGIATEKRKLGNTIATLDASTLENAPISDFSQMIAGREPGVVALPSSGYTGEGARIRIRGSASLSQLNEPIVYVDGIRIDRSGVNVGAGGQGNPSRLDDIPPESIERVEILKGAAAATLYGTEASNGVIQIFTKRGKAGAPRFTMQGDWTGISVPTNRIDPIADFARSAADQQRISDRWGLNVGLYEPFEQDLVTSLLTTGFGQTYSASVSGGSDQFQYFVSGRFADEDGPYDAAQNFDPAPGFDEAENDTNRRVATTSNITIIPNSTVRIGLSTLYAEMSQHTPDNSNNIYGAFSSTLMTQLRLATENNLYGNPAFATTRENMYQFNGVESSHFAGSMTIGFTPTDAFRLDATVGLDFTSDDGVTYRPYGWNVDGYSTSTPYGNRGATERRSKEITTDLKGSYVADLGGLENTFLFGAQGFLRQNQFAGGSGEVFPAPDFSVLSALGSESSYEWWERVTQVGAYLQDQIGYDDWVFVTLGGRWDANSAFGEEFNTAFYPKASISVVPSQGLDWSSEMVSTVRVRAALGKSGLQPGAFDQLTTFTSLNSAMGPGIEPENLGNPALQPEVSTEWEVGTELGLFNDRWSLDATYWDRTVNDALVDRQFPVTGGFVAPQLVNIGAVEAHGLEVSLRGSVYQTEGVTVNVFANGAYLKEKISSMGGAPPLKTGGSYPRYRNFLVEGYAPGSFFGAEVDRSLAIPLNIDGSCTEPTEAEALAYFGVPRNPSVFKPLAIGNSDFGTPNGGLASHNCGDGLLYTYLGKPAPDWQGSFGFNIAFGGNWELSSLMEYKAGNYSVQDLSGMFRRANAVIGRNTPRSVELYSTLLDPASTDRERLDAAIAWATEIEGLSPMSGMNGVYPADFIKWRELSLSYRVPSDVVEGFGLATATVNLGARNLMTWVNSKYTGMDPEGNVLGRCNGGLDCNFLDSTEGWGIPIPRRFTFSTRITF
ncbi:MAG: SusC/RagA family TonB-linked outer membrane protein [Gemmatimonadota bacterium]|nr:SusC/RagA family TonB-linked outer membrane protein [Gemmatimonadota bacterium]